MKTLNNLELSLISGGLCFVNGCIQVSSEGIPSQHFNIIEKNMQLLFNGNINQNQLYINVINTNSFDYLHVYIQNILKANRH